MAVAQAMVLSNLVEQGLCFGLIDVQGKTGRQGIGWCANEQQEKLQGRKLRGEPEQSHDDTNMKQALQQCAGG